MLCVAGAESIGLARQFSLRLNAIDLPRRLGSFVRCANMIFVRENAT